MRDAHLVALAIGAFLGSLHPASPVPQWAVVAGTCLAYASRQPLLLVLCVAILCSSLSARSWAGIESSRTGLVDAEATVLSDPVRRGGGTTAVMRIDGKRVLASGWGRSGALLSRTAVGERVQIGGRYAIYRGSRERQAALHVGTQLTLESVDLIGPPNPLFQLANGVRSKIALGAASLSAERRALLTGLVYGDDRDQSALVEADFRLAGLTHLLAVSGQNVAYVLTLCGPATRRLTLRSRWIFTLFVLVVFATVTRFEPSVLRATVMAGLAVTGQSLGREASGARLLAMAVTALLIVDPLLASTVAFQLSVAASSGIAWLYPPLRGRVGDKKWTGLRDGFAVTLAAQLGVAPVLITTFGPVSLVSLPANVVAGPVAGVAMTWGMTAGLVAGFVHPAISRVIHIPTNGMLFLLESIARVASLAPLAPVGLGWIALALVNVLVWKRVTESRAIRLGVCACWVFLVLALLPRPVVGTHRVGPNSAVWTRDGHTVLILRDTHATTWLLDDFSQLETTRVDVVLISDPTRFNPQIEQLGERLGLGQVRVVGERGLRFTVGQHELEVAREGNQLVLHEPG